MSDWTSNEAREFLSIIRGEAEKVVKDFGDKQSSVYACLAVVTDIAASGDISVRLLSSPSDGSQDFVVRNRSGSVLEVGDSVWLHYWSDYTNVYIAMRNAGDGESDLTPEDIGAQPNDVTCTNLLINGGFDIWNRGTSFTSAGYTADRWRVLLGSGMSVSTTRQSFTVGQTDVPNEPVYSAQLEVSNPGSTNGYYAQRVEDVRTAAGMNISYSFYAKCASGTYSSQVIFSQYFGSGGSSAVYINGSNFTLSTTWQKFTGTVTVPSISGKTITTNTYLEFRIKLATASGINTISISNVQVNYGSVALPFVPRSFADELRLCMRYFHIIPSGIWHTCTSSTTTIISGPIFLPVRMRIAPTCVFAATSNISVYLATSAITTTYVTFSLVGSSTGLFITVTPTLTAGSVTQYQPGAMAFNQNIICDAEL